MKIMRLSLHVIGLTAALLFGAHIDAYLDPVSQQGYVRASTETTEAVTLTDIKRDTETVAKPTENDAVVSAASADTTTTETTAVIIEEVKLSSHTEELKASLSEIEKALKESTLAVAEVLNGIVSLVAPIANIAISVATLSVSLTKIFWFSGKLMYTAAAAVAEGLQTAHAYLTQ